MRIGKPIKADRNLDAEDTEKSLTLNRVPSVKKKACLILSYQGFSLCIFVSKVLCEVRIFDVDLRGQPSRELFAQHHDRFDVQVLINGLVQEQLALGGEIL